MTEIIDLHINSLVQRASGSEVKNINDPSGASRSEPPKATEGFLLL